MTGYKHLTRWMQQWACTSLLSAICLVVDSQGDALVCQSCHADVVTEWGDSDHAWSMRLPKRSAVKAPFTGETASFDGLAAQFDQERRDPGALEETGGFLGNPDGVGETRFIIKLRDTKVRENEFQSYVVRYTFGHDPLQQFLIPLGSDRLQVAPFAFDTRPESEGGQRWIHLEAFESDERWSRIDWRQPLQNWNGMCADCHSRGFERGYDVESDQFQSRFDAINVDCLSCHVIAEDHGVASKAGVGEKTQVTGGWVRPAGAAIAHWQGPSRASVSMDTCFACHSLRTSLTDGFRAGSVFLDHFRPEPVLPPHYQPNGQIDGEVYVYGSFLQSKMYAAGVQCIDCHDPHTTELKRLGNEICATCHAPKVYDVEEHHRHLKGTAGAACVACHMPGKTYMGVDFRRDHRFGVPHSPQAKRLGVGDPCQSCHEDRWTAFISAAGGEPAISQRSKVNAARLALWADARVEPTDVLTMLNDPQLPAILKAARVASLPAGAVPWAGEFLPVALSHPAALVRLSAIEWARTFALSVDPPLLANLTQDKSLAVQIAALDLVMPRGSVNSAKNRNPTSELALLEAQRIYLAQGAWRGEGRLLRAQRALALGETEAAERELKAAIRQEPFFEGGYLNLADLYRLKMEEARARAVLQEGLKKLPDSGMLHYSLGLAWVRSKEYDLGLAALLLASELAPARTDFFYASLLVEDALGRRASAQGRIMQRFGGQPPEAIAQLLRRWQR